MKKNIDLILIILILILGGVLRLYKPFDIPYTPDELSALFRLEFSDFSQMIQKGVKLDGHPAGVQVFLYFWTGIFGTSELLVKLPFILMGIASVLLVYLIGKSWFNPMVGLVSASFIATLQYTVMYSQIARPYSSGLFFTLLMVYFWDKVIFKSNKHFNLNLFLFILSSAACAYNHHFSLLIAIIVGATGIFFIKREHLLKYIGAGIMIFILYLPHLDIFFYQLNVGGVENWLSKPTPRFFLNYFNFIFHYSYILIAIVLLLITGGFIYKRQASFNKPFFYISLAWFLIPLLTGYFYSVYFSSVLQFSILIFTFPFLLFLLFSNLPNFNPALKSAIILILCSLSIFTLIYDRKYYDEGYIALFKQNVKNIKQAKQDYGDEVLTFLDGFKDVSEHYLTKESNSNLNWLFDFNSSKEFVSFIENNPRKKLALACISSIPPEYIPLILNFYPVVLEKKDYFGGSYYLFSRTGKEKKQIQRTISFNDFENDYPVWNEINKNNITDSIPVSGSFSYLINSEQEWGPGFSFDLKDHIKHRNDFLDISVKILPMENLEEILLVSVLESMGKTIEWRGTPINQNEFKIQGDWIKTFQSVKLSDIPYIPNDTRVKVFIWNKSKNKFLMDDFEIKVREGNPLLYGIFEEH